ncbi:MAG: hypothetical protein IVW55_07540 [Chloroflexi bacterium]|nr:hypothetical protein [Chloroflexota bacterium]
MAKNPPLDLQQDLLRLPDRLLPEPGGSGSSRRSTCELVFSVTAFIFERQGERWLEPWGEIVAFLRELRGMPNDWAIDQGYSQ